LSCCFCFLHNIFHSIALPCYWILYVFSFVASCSCVCVRKCVCGGVTMSFVFLCMQWFYTNVHNHSNIVRYLPSSPTHSFIIPSFTYYKFSILCNICIYYEPQHKHEQHYLFHATTSFPFPFPFSVLFNSV